MSSYLAMINAHYATKYFEELNKIKDNHFDLAVDEICNANLGLKF